MPDRRHSAVLFRLAVNRDGDSGRNIVRETLESAALAAAVELATDADRANVIEINEMLEQAVRQDDPQTYHRESRRFHIGLTSPSRMLRLMHMLESAWNITEPVQAMVHVEQADRARLHQDHRVMLDAFVARDADRLMAAATATAQQGGRHASPWEGASSRLIVN
jgi:DNA-binding GntR family transcriptional regulator